MTKFRIVIEDNYPRFFEKVFEAATLEDAKAQAVEEAWTEENGWLEDHDHAVDGYCEIRDELCAEVEA